jgi:GxxExxY protein
MDISNEEMIQICETVAAKLGKGYSENIYQEALCVMFRKRGIKYSKENVIPIVFEDITVGFVRADIVLNDLKIVIECKSIDNDLREGHLPQIITYMEHLGYNRGYFVNFIQNPAKDDIEVYCVVKNGPQYKFTSNKGQIDLDNFGRKIEVNYDNKQETEWIDTHLIYEENAMLEKKDAKEVYDNVFPYKKTGNVHLRNFLEEVQRKCNENFRDKQIKGQKYCCIMNWKFRDNF